MAEAMPVIIGISSILGTGYSIYSNIQAANEAEDIAEANADRIAAETEEQARRLEKEKARELAMGRARAYASGFTGEGSSQLVLEDLERTRTEEIEWLKRSGASRANIALMEGSTAKKQGYAQAIGQFAQGAQNTYAWFEEYA